MSQKSAEKDIEQLLWGTSYSHQLTLGSATDGTAAFSLALLIG